MKNKSNIAIIITVVLIFTLSSCQSVLPSISVDNNNVFGYIENDDEPYSYNAISGLSELKYYEGCIYFFNGGSSVGRGNYSTVYRYNVATGNLTTVCPDPLCSHDIVDCPFYGIAPLFFVYNNNIYYKRSYGIYYYEKNEYSGYYADFVAFNLETSKIRQYFKYTETQFVPMMGKELYVGNYRFYYEFVNDDKNLKSYFNIHRVNLDDGSIVILKQDNLINPNAVTAISISDTLLFSVNYKIYFTDGSCVYSTDYDMFNRQDIINGKFIYDDIYTDGEYIYWGESEDLDNINLQTLYRAKLDGSGEKSPLGIKTASWQLTQKYIYYLNPQETIIGKNRIEQRPGSEIVLNNNEIRRAAHDGLSNEAVFTLIQDDTNFEIYSYTCVGNYIYAAYHTYTDKNNDGAFDDSEYYQSTDEKTYSILRIDVTTGDTYYIHCGTGDS